MKRLRDCKQCGYRRLFAGIEGIPVVFRVDIVCLDDIEKQVLPARICPERVPLVVPEGDDANAVKTGPLALHLVDSAFAGAILLKSSLADSKAIQERHAMNSDKLKGGVNEAKGKIKKAAGELTDDESAKAEGSVDKVKGAIQKGIGEVKDAVKKATK